MGKVGVKRDLQGGVVDARNEKRSRRRNLSRAFFVGRALTSTRFVEERQ
jgi:hypothetical protein